MDPPFSLCKSMRQLDAVSRGVTKLLFVLAGMNQMRRKVRILRD
jgi:hypothetical protein